MFGHVRLLAIWNTVQSACFANERRLTKLDQPCFYNGWRQISNLFRWWGILIPVRQTLVFFQMCMQKLLTSHSVPLSLPLIHGLRRLGNLIILAKFHLISDKMRSLQKQPLIFRGRSSVTKKCHITSLVKSASTLNLCWLRSIAVNVNKQVICSPVVINHVNDFGNLDWLMVELDDNKKNPLSFQSVHQRLVSGRNYREFKDELLHLSWLKSLIK